jgi:hypothetical protein
MDGMFLSVSECNLPFGLCTSRQEFECCSPKFWYLFAEDDIESSFICLKLDVVWTGRGLKQGMRLGDT